MTEAIGTMSFDRPKHRAGTSVDKPTPDNQRVVFLEVLGQVIRETYSGVAAETVPRDGGLVLFVTSNTPCLRRLDVGADFTDNGWRYVWASDSRPIGPTEDTVGVAGAIIRYLRRPVSM
jgi:hypothetical protein